MNTKVASIFLVLSLVTACGNAFLAPPAPSLSLTSSLVASARDSTSNTQLSATKLSFFPSKNSPSSTRAVVPSSSLKKTKNPLLKLNGIAAKNGVAKKKLVAVPTKKVVAAPKKKVVAKAVPKSVPKPKPAAPKPTAGPKTKPFFETVFGLDLFNYGGDNYGARSGKKLKSEKITKSSYIPRGLTVEQYNRYRKQDQFNKNLKYQKNVAKAGQFLSFNKFYNDRGTDLSGKWRKSVTLGHRMAKTKYDWGNSMKAKGFENEVN